MNIRWFRWILQQFLYLLIGFAVLGRRGLKYRAGILTSTPSEGPEREIAQGQERVRFFVVEHHEQSNATPEPQ
jgi:hypothetical protein